MKRLFLLPVLAPLAAIAAEPLMPSAEGTTWNYILVQEKVSNHLDLDEPTEMEKISVTYRLGGTEKVDHKDLRRLEIYRGDALDGVDLLSIEENRIVCPARTDPRGVITKLVPPQTMLATPLVKGNKWSFNGTIGGTKVSQQYEVADEEDLEVPAGKFHAWRIHCEQTAPGPATIDRWFVPGTGFVKVATVVKGQSGIAAQRSWLNLKDLPTAELSKSPSSESVKVTGGVSSEPQGEFKTEFNENTETIYARWHGRDLADQAKIRAVFVADNVADISADSQIDEMETTAPAPNSGGNFALSRPEGGWTTGDYRVEFYVDDTLATAVKFKIVK
jgi:hypothetical protein